jgi:hypothetical protein
MLAPMGCCGDERAHCHGVLVRHADGRTECIEGPGCDAGEPTHDWGVGCAELGCGCGEEAASAAAPVAA